MCALRHSSFVKYFIHPGSEQKASTESNFTAYVNPKPQEIGNLKSFKKQLSLVFNKTYRKQTWKSSYAQDIKLEGKQK